MLQVIYSSITTHDFANEELVALLEQARRKNFRLDITGMLVYDERAFLQVLEGPNDAIERLMETLCADPRHHKVRIMSSKNIASREFGSWDMAFFKHDAGMSDPDGFLDFASFKEEFTLESSLATQMLALFRDGLFRDSAEHHPGEVGSCTVTIRSKLHDRDPKRRRYLTELGRAIAISLPDVPLVITGGGADILFNQHRDLDCGEIELF